MSEIKTSRPFQQRFLEGFDRSQLREEVARAKPKRGGLRRTYASWALGASLALGGVGLPIKMIENAQSKGSRAKSATAVEMESAPIDRVLAGDIEQARTIASQVAGGVEAVAHGVQAAAQAMGSATAAPARAAAETPRTLSLISEHVKEQFFSKEIPFGSIIYREAKKNNLRPELVAAVVHTESKFKPTARSSAGALGLMQLVPRTGRWMGARNLMNPAENISAGTRYLAYLHERFDGDEQKVIAAYNAGEGNVRRFRGVPPFQETRNYVTRVRSFEDDLGARLEGRFADAAVQTADAR